MIERYVSNRAFRLFVGLVLVGGFLTQVQRASESRSSETETIIIRNPAAMPNVALAAPINTASSEGESIAQWAARDPVGFFERALERYDRSVRDYTCTFAKQELVGKALTKEQVMNAWFREKPFSVRLEWIKNEDKCSRVLYVADRWVEEGKQMAVVEPGAIARLFVSYVMRQIDGPDAKKSSRRTIDQFGVRNSLTLILKYCRLAQEQKVLDFRYVGKGEVNGRETLVFERRLPYTGDQSVWPDRVLVVHMDRELLVPTLCIAYADDAKQVLLGKYLTTDLKLNQNLPESVFTKEGMGL